MGNIDFLRRWSSNFRKIFKPEDVLREEQSSTFGGGGCYGSRKRKFPPEIDLEDEPTRNPYNIIVKKKRVDFRGQEPRTLQQQYLQPFPTSSREFFKDMSRKSISGKEKIKVITIRDSDEEKEEKDEEEEKEQGPSTDVHKNISERKSIKLHPSSRQVAKSPEKRSLKKGHWGPWFKKQISLNDSSRHKEKADYIKLLKSTAVPPYQSRNSPLYESFGKANLDPLLPEPGPSRTDDEVIILTEKIVREPRKKKSNLELELHSSIFFDKDWSKKRARSYKEVHRERQERMENEEKSIPLLKNESTLDKDLNERIRRKLKITGIIELEEQMPEIDEEMEKIIDLAKSYGPENQVLKTLFSIDITKRDVQTLAPMKWLNDNIIIAYMEMIADRSKGQNFKKCYPFRTLFYPKLIQFGYLGLKQWTNEVDIFSFDLLLFPIHLGDHWCLSVADIPNKAIRYYDSLGGRNDHCLKALLRYLKSEMKERKHQILDEGEWKLENVSDIPKQENESDCGMFICKFAEYISRGSDLTFGQENMNYFRKRMIYELVTNTLLFP